MGRKRFDDGALDRLLRESLAGAELPDEAAVIRLKRGMSEKQAERRGVALWWLPALCGTAVSACVLYALSFVADWKCFTAALLVLGVSTVFSWLLTILSVLKIDTFKEASRLI